MMHWSENVVRSRGLVLAGALLLAALGLLAWKRLPLDAFPDVTNQQVMVLSEAPGLGPVDVEQQVSIPIETVMGGLPRVSLVRSLSKSGLSQVVVVFEDGVDTYLARQLVTERLQQARGDLPPGVEPELGPISTGLGEIFQYTLESDRHDLRELRALQDWVVAPRLRALAGVNEVNSFGGEVRQVQVLVDPDRLLKYRITLDEVVDAIAASNRNVGGGFVTRSWEQENLRLVGLMASSEDLRGVVLRAEDGTPVTLEHVASVEIGGVTRLGAVTRDGAGEVVAGMVIMLKGENAREVVERVKAALPSIERSLPEGVRVDVYYDRTELVSAVIGTVRGALLQGGLLVMLVLLALVGSLRGALVALASLPMTALLVFLGMGAAGLSANLMTLGGLAIAIGMVVDGSIVVTENVMRHRQRVAGPRAVVDALREVARPIAFSILIIVLVFLPLFALEGMEGKLFKPLAITLIFAMLGSLAVALLLAPALLAGGRTVERAEPRFLRRLRDGYLALLARTLARRRLTLGLAAGALLLVLALLPRLGTAFLPDLDEGALAINVVRLPNAGLEGSVRTAAFIERRLAAFPEVRTVVSKTGRAEIGEDPMGPEQTDVLVMLHPERDWTTGRDKPALQAAIAADLAQVPGLRLAFSQPIALRVNELISGVRSDLALKFFGPDLERLKAVADDAATALAGVEGAEDISVEQVTGFSQLDLLPDRRALARHQLGVEDLGALVETALGGRVATELVDGRVRTGVQVRLPAARRASEADILGLLVPTPAGLRVPLGQLAALVHREGPAQVSREQGMRRVVVETNIRDRDLGSFVAEAREALDPLVASLPPGYWLELGGSFENQQRAMARLSIAVPTAVLLIGLMLYVALRSAGAAVLVLANLPFALLGGVAAMLLLRIDLSVPATVGFIALFGMAVQNGTVLVTFITQLRQQGLAVRDAVLQACGLRFRALLMTTLTTVLGLAPMLVARGPGAELQRPLAAVVIGGLLSATALTLLILPTLYATLPPRAPAPGDPADAV